MRANEATTPAQPTAAEIARLAQIFLLGTRKQPVVLPEFARALIAGSDAPAPAMLGLVLAGQHARFARPALPALSPLRPSDLARHADPRPMISQVSRRLLKQFLATVPAQTVDDPFASCVDRAALRGLRLHPFDLTALPASRRESVLAAAQGEEDAEPPALDAESWQALAPDQRPGALRRLRETSPEAARTLLEAVFRLEAPAERVALLRAMSLHLSADDVPFLESVAKDRSDSVRTAVLQLLARIPGTEAQTHSLNHAAAMMTVEKPRKRGPVRLKLQGNAGPARSGNESAIYRAIEGLDIVQLAARLGLDREAFVEAVPKGEDALILALITTAAYADDTALALRLVASLDNPMSALGSLYRLQPEGIDMSAPFRAALTEAWFDLALENKYPVPGAFPLFYRMNGGPLSAAFAHKLIASPPWRVHIAHVGRLDTTETKDKTPSAIRETAMLIPDAVLDAYLASIAGLSPHLTHSARLFAEYCKSLAETVPVAPLTQPSR